MNRDLFLSSKSRVRTSVGKPATFLAGAGAIIEISCGRGRARGPKSKILAGAGGGQNLEILAGAGAKFENSCARPPARSARSARSAGFFQHWSGQISPDRLF